MFNDRLIETKAQMEEGLGTASREAIALRQPDGEAAIPARVPEPEEKVWRQRANDRAIEDIRAMLLAPVSTHRERR